MEIKPDDLSGAEVRELLREHRESMFLHSPPESVHALDLDGLRAPGITFWTAWEGGELLGCGALKELDPAHAEIKSMRTAARHLRKGVASELLRHMLAEAGRRGYRRLSLETGSAEAFDPARRLYAHFGFTYCGPFADYVEDPYSVFMTRELSWSPMEDAGFWIEEGVLAPPECDALLDGLSSMRNGRAGARHLMRVPAVAELAHDERLLRIARRALGACATPYRATLFAKSGRANWLVVWHQDTALPLAARCDSPEWGPWSEKAGVLYAHAPAWALARALALRLHLDESNAENGPLRVVPGSHAAGVLSDEEVFDAARRQEHVSCTVARGGVLAMRPLLIHASSKARTAEPRRVLHIEYADSLVLRDGIRLAVA